MVFNKTWLSIFRLKGLTISNRQTIEQFFKESTRPFSAGQMPFQKFRPNPAYLQLTTIPENSMQWLKKTAPCRLATQCHGNLTSSANSSWRFCIVQKANLYFTTERLVPLLK